MSKDEDFESFIRMWFLPRLFCYSTLNSFLTKVKEVGLIETMVVTGSIADGGPDRFILTIQHSEFKLKGEENEG